MSSQNSPLGYSPTSPCSESSPIATKPNGRKKRLRQISRKDLDSVLKQGLSQKEASKQLGVSISTIQRRFRENYPHRQWKECVALHSQRALQERARSGVGLLSAHPKFEGNVNSEMTTNTFSDVSDAGRYHFSLEQQLQQSNDLLLTPPTYSFSRSHAGVSPQNARLYPQDLSEKLQYIVEECEGMRERKLHAREEVHRGCDPPWSTTSSSQNTSASSSCVSQNLYSVPPSMDFSKNASIQGPHFLGATTATHNDLSHANGQNQYYGVNGVNMSNLVGFLANSYGQTSHFAPSHNGNQKIMGSLPNGDKINSFQQFLLQQQFTNSMTAGSHHMPFYQ